MLPSPEHVVQVTTRNTPALTLGIIATVFGALALTFGWIPFLGLFAIPVAGIGGALACLGLLLCMLKGQFTGMGMPLLGLFICVVAAAIPILSTGGASVALQGPMDYATASTADDEAEYIAASLELYDVTAKRVLDSWAEVSLKLRNHGARDLESVSVTVYFHDARGATIAEETLYPLLRAVSFSSTGNTLKSGYIWEGEPMNREVPSEWQAGAVTAKVTGIRFSR